MHKYKPIPDAVFAQEDDHQFFEDVYYHLFELFDEKCLPLYLVEKQEHDVPICAKNAWYLWLFSMEVSSSGIPDFLINSCLSSEELKLIHRALNIVQADELLVLIEAAIALIRLLPENQDHCRFFYHEEWFAQFEINARWDSLDEIAERSWSLASFPLSSLVAAYLRAHRTELQMQS